MFDPGHRTDRRPPFRFAAYTRVAFSDTDAQGVVYYGRYLPYFDLARTEYHRELGEVGGAGRAEFVVRASNVEYLAPARFDDLLEVFVRIARIGRTSVTYEYAAYRVGPGDEEALMVIADPDPRPDRPRRPDHSAGAGRLPRRGVGARGLGVVTEQEGPLESVRRAVQEGDEADDVLRSVVAVLVDDGSRRLGRDLLRRGRRARARPRGGRCRPGRAHDRCPSSTTARPSPSSPPTAASIAALLEQIAPLIAEHCLVGWDTGGVPWDEA